MFIDAVQVNKQHPDTFKIPSQKEIDSLLVGDYCKISEGHERFWVKIKLIALPILVGIIDNDLICTKKHNLKCGDQIKFKTNHIYSIIRGEDL